MRIGVSACLLGINCKYNGLNNKNDELIKQLKNHKLTCVCPEVSGGLSTPRTPAEIKDGVVVNQDGVSVDAEFRKGAKIELENILNNNCELVILQSRSPSCGLNEIYDGTFSKKLKKGHGIFAKLLIENNIEVVDIKDFISLPKE